MGYGMVGILFYYRQPRPSNPSPAMRKYCFLHLSNGKKYIVGAYDRDEAIELVAEITNDFNFVEAEIPEGY
jgi:hypothetical protein